VAQAYADFQKFCREVGEEEVTQREFGKRLRELVPGLERKQVKEGGVQTWRYRGIRLAGAGDATATREPAMVRLFKPAMAAAR